MYKIRNPKEYNEAGLRVLLYPIIDDILEEKRKKKDNGLIRQFRFRLKENKLSTATMLSILDDEFISIEFNIKK